MVISRRYPSRNFTLPWVEDSSGRSKSKLMTFEPGWIISMVESRPAQPVDHCKILATYAKWCHTIWKDIFPKTVVPTTASIKVVSTSYKTDNDCWPSFWVSTSLPHADLKEEARLIREKYMHDLFGRLPAAPIFSEAVKQGGNWGHIKWGHCAETLTAMWLVLIIPKSA